MSVLAPMFAVVIVALMIYASYLMQKRRRDTIRAIAAATERAW